MERKNIEEWKPIEGYENIYEISSFGRIKSCKRIIKYKNGVEHHSKEHIIKPFLSKGYNRIRLCKNNTQKRFLVHRLVAKAFIPNPNNYTIINHIDSNRRNNNVNNLEWCTQSHNIKEAYRVGRKIYTEKNREAFKLAHKACCKRVWQLDNDKVKIKIFDSCYDAERELGLTRGCIYQALKNNNKSGGFYWQLD